MIRETFDKLLYAFEEEMSTLEIINDANLQETSERGNIDCALNACVRRLRGLMERLNDFEDALWEMENSVSGAIAESEVST